MAEDIYGNYMASLCCNCAPLQPSILTTTTTTPGAPGGDEGICLFDSIGTTRAPVLLADGETFLYAAYGDCYLLVVTYHDGHVRLNYYDPNTNTLVQDALGDDNLASEYVYDPTSKLFVAATLTGFTTFNPVTKAVESFDSGQTGVHGYVVPVQSEVAVFALMGQEAGTNKVQMGTVDPIGKTVTVLGTLPSSRYPYYWDFCPKTRTFYGVSQGGATAIIKFSLATSTSQGFNPATPGEMYGEFVWDNDIERFLIGHSGKVYEFDPSVDDITATRNVSDGLTMMWQNIYSHSLQKMFGIGNGDLVGNSVLAYDAQAHTAQVLLSDYDYYRGANNPSSITGIVKLSDSLALVSLNDGSKDGVRLVALT